MEATPVIAAPIEKKRWECELHGILCSIGHPCFECKKEMANSSLIENQYRDESSNKIREKNSHPRLRI